MSCKCGAAVVVIDGDGLCSNCWYELAKKRMDQAKRRKGLLHVDRRVLAEEEATIRRRASWRAA